MSHARTQIRQAVATLLTGLATTGARVFQSRMRPQKDADLPCLLVTTESEDISGDTFGDTQDRRLTVIVRGIALNSAALDQTLDQIALEVETAMATSGANLRKIDVDFDDELEKPAGVIALVYEALYFTHAGNPAVRA